MWRRLRVVRSLYRTNEEDASRSITTINGDELFSSYCLTSLQNYFLNLDLRVESRASSERESFWRVWVSERIWTRLFFFIKMRASEIFLLLLLVGSCALADPEPSDELFNRLQPKNRNEDKCYDENGRPQVCWLFGTFGLYICIYIYIQRFLIRFFLIKKNVKNHFYFQNKILRWF